MIKVVNTKQSPAVCCKPH